VSTLLGAAAAVTGGALVTGAATVVAVAPPAPKFEYRSPTTFDDPWLAGLVIVELLIAAALGAAPVIATCAEGATVAPPRTSATRIWLPGAVALGLTGLAAETALGLAAAGVL
jgi:hypothetical protein